MAEYLRVIDESDEDCLYPASYFVLVQLPDEAEEVLRAAAAVPDLAVAEKGATYDKAPRVIVSHGLMLPNEGWLIQEQGPQCLEITWPQPVECNAVCVRLDGRHLLPRAYSLEAWDGEQWRLLARESDNVMETRAHRFPRLAAHALRLSVYEPAGGWRMVRGVSVHNLPDEGK